MSVLGGKGPRWASTKSSRFPPPPVSRADFSRNRDIDKRDFAAIEFLLRKGRRQLDAYSSPAIKDVR